MDRFMHELAVVIHGEKVFENSTTTIFETNMRGKYFFLYFVSISLHCFDTKISNTTEIERFC